jgi:Na+/H+-dicarboxylate symporter/ABC-type amino acid transport substrate-binding protein
VSSSQQTLVGLGLGIAMGLLLGDRAEPLRTAGDAFVRLLQMTVLPYVTVSLVAGIGGLDPAAARRLFVRVGGLVLALWAIALGTVLLLPLAFPPIVSASFFSTTLVEERAPTDFVALYIPSNPFHSLANNLVPAVVLFSSLLGFALIGAERKERLIENLNVLERALARTNRLVVRLTPLGLFAIAAHTVGSLDFAQLARLRVFLLGYAAMTLVLSLVVLPGLVACLTPIPARSVRRRTRDVLITGFVTGDLFVVLPTLVERCKELLREHAGAGASDSGAPDVIVPAFYNVPHVAKVLSLSFVLFAAWYSETALAAADYPRLAGAGLVVSFGSMNLAVPFLLDLVRVPADTFQLFLATGVVNSRFGTLAAAMHMVVLALAGTYALEGRLRLSLPGIARFAASSAAAIALTVFALGGALRALGVGRYEGAQAAGAMGLVRPQARAARVLDALPPPPAGSPRPVLSDLRAGRPLRVGFVPDQAPYSHFNTAGELVGFDVEMAHALARELGVPLELAPVVRSRLEETLEEGRVDLVMAGVAVTTERASRITFSPPYMDETLAFMVPDHRRAEFASAAWIRAQPGIRLGVPDLPYLRRLVAGEFPRAELLDVPLDTASAALSRNSRGLDALCLTAERASFLTLLHPQLAVAVPHPLELRVPLAYPVARNDLELARFLGLWIDLKRKDGTVQALYEHWILGRDAFTRTRHWSILDDVLHWPR